MGSSSVFWKTEAEQQEVEEEPPSDFGGLFFNSFESGGGNDDLLVCGCCPPSGTPSIPPRISTKKADSDILKATAQLAALESEVITFAVDSGAAVIAIDPKRATSYPLLENAESRAGKT